MITTMPGNEENQLLFTGEMLYPWMLDIYKNLKPFKGAANILANKDDWTKLYDKNKLKFHKNMAKKHGKS